MFLDISNIILEGIFATEPQETSFHRKYLCEFHGHTVQFTKNQITLFLKGRNEIGNTLVYFKVFREKIKQLTEQILEGEKVTQLSFRIKNYHLSITWKRKSRVALKLLVRELDKRHLQVKKVCIGEESSSAGSQVDYETIRELAAGTKVRSFHFVQFIIHDPEFPLRKPSLKLIPGKCTSGNAASTNFTFIASAFSQTIEQLVDILENDDINGTNEYVEQFTSDGKSEHSSSSFRDERSSTRSVESTGFDFAAETVFPAKELSAAATVSSTNGAASLPATYDDAPVSHDAVASPAAAATSSPPSCRQLLHHKLSSSTTSAREQGVKRRKRKHLEGNASSRACKGAKFKSRSAELVGETEFLQSLSDSSDEDVSTSSSKLFSFIPSNTPEQLASASTSTGPRTTAGGEQCSSSESTHLNLNFLPSNDDDDNPFFNGTLFDGLW